MSINAHGSVSICTRGDSVCIYIALVRSLVDRQVWAPEQISHDRLYYHLWSSPALDVLNLQWVGKQFSEKNLPSAIFSEYNINYISDAFLHIILRKLSNCESNEDGSYCT